MGQITPKHFGYKKKEDGRDKWVPKYVNFFFKSLNLKKTNNLLILL